MNTLLITCGTLESGGAERVISILSYPFAEHFDKVWIVTWRDAPVFYSFDSRVQIISLKNVAKSDRMLNRGIELRKLVKRLNPTIVLSFLTPFNMLTTVSLYGLSTIKIVAERNDPRYIRGGILMKIIRNLIYNYVDGILCQTELIKSCYPKKLQRKIHIIYNPVFLDSCLVGKALVTPKKNRIVTVGRLHKQKNHKMLIDAFYSFYKNHSDYTLTIYGKGTLKNELQEYIYSLGMESCVFLKGEDKYVHKNITDSRMFVMTSLFEGMPNALIEAMCLGLPCISTKVSGATDLINTNVNGILVETTVESISKAMEYLVSDESKSESLGNNAIKIYKNLSVESISIEWINYLDSFIYKN